MKQPMESFRYNKVWLVTYQVPEGFLWYMLWPVFISLQVISLTTKKTKQKKHPAMLEQLDKCYIYLIGLYMPIGETSLHKIQFLILMSNFRAGENASVLRKESNFVITGYLRGSVIKVIMSWHGSNKQQDSSLLKSQRGKNMLSRYGYDDIEQLKKSCNMWTVVGDELWVTVHVK